ncbi:hypothetical protein Tco_1414100 [Tanacetum coccineum]
MEKKKLKEKIIFLGFYGHLDSRTRLLLLGVLQLGNLLDYPGGLIDDASSGIKDDVWDSKVSAGAAIDKLGITRLICPADMDGWQWVLDHSGIFTIKHMFDIVDSAT